jgi:hypothetical protein
VLFLAAAPADDKRSPAKMLALVRPIAIDDFKVAGIDARSDAGDAPAVLREGNGYRAMFATPDPTRRVVLSGKIWAPPCAASSPPTSASTSRPPAFVFSEDEHDELCDARVVVVGGGVIGCSVAYHLAHMGWKDVVLLERDRSPRAPPGTPPASS